MYSFSCDTALNERTPQPTATTEPNHRPKHQTLLFLKQKSNLNTLKNNVTTVIDRGLIRQKDAALTAK